MMNTLSLFPMKTALPPLVGKTARTCTSMTVLFIRANRNRAEEEKQASGRLVIVIVLLLVIDLIPFEHEQENESQIVLACAPH
jgi:hypothetical protein